MVTRKPLPEGHIPASLPYPVTPISTENPQSFRPQQTQQTQQIQEEPRASRAHLQDEDPNVWGEGLQNNSRNGDSKSKDIPDALRVGPAGRSNTSSQASLRPDAASTNPFLRKQVQNEEGKESSADVWGEAPQKSGAPSIAPPPIPSGHYQAPTQQLSELSVSESSTNPWQPATVDKPKMQPPPIPTIQREDSGNEAWSTAPAKQTSAISSSDSSQQPVLVDIEEPDSPAWDEDEPSPIIPEMPANNGKESKQISDDRHAWDDDEGHSPRREQAISSRLEVQDDPSQSGEGWNIIDHETLASGAQQSGITTADGHPPLPPYEEEQAPALPPRRSQDIPDRPPQPEEQPPLQPPRPSEPPQRPTIITEAPSTTSVVSNAAPSSAVQRQKKETYEIKKIAWHDVTAEQNPRISPILVQNLNGPCPLLALVNALTLSTPANVETALVETLRSREQVSLGLLLDAVFDELMSGRRGDAAQELPDVSDLYSFLITLHTGMNVNPRFFPPAASKSPHDPRNSMSHVHPSAREAGIPGTFEETREMRLYSTFSVPLIHGWIPERDSPAYTALARSAKSYEDSQNLMFNEEGLEDKLRREGLSFEEQAMLEDIATIKAFFSSNPTQLTKFGLETITTSVAPGAVAILFRNDHFSTLYRHPQTLQLLQLVTDMGYAGHEEVVWESLIDVNGENAEFFSGDFRLVGGAPAATEHSTAHESGNGWDTVPDRRGDQSAPQNTSGHLRTPSSFSNHHEEPPHSPNIEQEDHDLALALQLQEEEEQRHEQEVARRRRETELSQKYIEQSNQGNVPVTRGGRGGSTRSRGSGSGRGATRGRTAPEIRPLIPPRRNNNNNQAPPPATTATDPEAGIDAPPPSYEHAANQPPYTPTADHPAHPQASPNQSRPGLSGGGVGTSGLPPNAGRRTSTGPVYQGRGGGRGGNGGNGMGRGQGMGMGRGRGRGGPGMGVQQQQPEKEKDCVVM